MNQGERDLPEFKIERLFKAPREVVWRAWTDPELLLKWLGPQGSEARMLEHSLQPGGVCHYEMSFGGGSPSFGRLEYQAVQPPERLTWRHMFSDALGGVTRHPANPQWPLVLLSTARFVAEGASTRLILTWVPVDAKPEEIEAFSGAMSGMRTGWEGSFTNLDALLDKGIPPADAITAKMAGKLRLVPVGEASLVLTRRFRAPPEAVFAAYTQPELISKWMLGPGDTWTMPICEVDLRAGGAGRYVWRSKDGAEMAVSMIFDEVEAPTKLVHRERFDEDWTGGEAQITTLFKEISSGTEVEMTLSYASEAARDAVLASPMAWGMETGYTKLESLLTQAP